jgi:hypothetical protein
MVMTVDGQLASAQATPFNFKMIHLYENFKHEKV